MNGHAHGWSGLPENIEALRTEYRKNLEQAKRTMGPQFTATQFKEFCRQELIKMKRNLTPANWVLASDIVLCDMLERAFDNEC